MDFDTAPNSEAALHQPPAKRSTPSALGWTIFLFVVLWAIFYALFRELPYVRNGSDIVFSAKIRLEYEGAVFPRDPGVTRVLIFGNSKILAGFVPAWFEQLSGAEHLRVSSFNSGFPGSDLYLPPLKAMCDRGQAPNVLLLTLPWNADPPRRGVFRFLPDDHTVIDTLFPFRNWIRDVTAFLLAASEHGGIVAYYRESQANERAVIAEGGYHLITEQSHFPQGRLPDDFHLESDQPGQIVARVAPAQSAQIAQLNQLIAQYRIRCYYVPFYLRQGEAAPAAPYDTRFAARVEGSTPCRLLGPNYYVYPNQLFADQTHLNQAGARLYTAALFQLLKENHVALQ